MQRPDIFVGLVGAAGTDLAPAKDQIRAQFSVAGYDYQEIRVSKLISEFFKIQNHQGSERDRIISLMNLGDKIRRTANHGGAVMWLVLQKISDELTKEDRKNPKVFVIDSLKNPDEISVLDSVFSRNYYTICVYSPTQERRERLATLIADSIRRKKNGDHYDQAEEIMRADESRKPEKLSQNLLNTFPRGDFFVANDAELVSSVKRFVELIFGHPFITPTNDENFMHLARTASLRSCDLSRQVGAAIVDSRGFVISTGCNEVPYPGGGIFSEGGGDPIDNRDWVSGGDPNQAEISSAVTNFISILRHIGLLNNSQTDKIEDEALAYELLKGQWKEDFSESRIRNLIEFGRIVHAEMHAICEAARVGRPIEGAILYCTTFPCHMCARHIIAAGIREVVYIEPYPKSLTKNLYEDEVCLEGVPAKIDNAVIFRPFVGVSPVVYRRLFNFRTRKNSDGTKIDWNIRSASPSKAILGIANVYKFSDYIDRFEKLEFS
jgi:cytidine deaminase